MKQIKEILAELEDICSRSLQEPYDNCGLQVGDPEAGCNRILLALDFRASVLEEALAKKADLIITHHPFLFQPLQSIDGSHGRGRLIYRLIQNQISLFAMHTNLDKVPFGVNGVLATAFDLRERIFLEPDASEAAGLGYVGFLPVPVSLEDLAQMVKETLDLPYIRYCGDAGRPLRRIAVLGGSGASLAAAAARLGAEAFISGDFKYHDADTAAELGIALIDAGHYHTEVGVLGPLAAKLQSLLDMEILLCENGSNPWGHC